MIQGAALLRPICVSSDDNRAPSDSLAGMSRILLRDYAPDEIDALAKFAHGVASALDNLQSRVHDVAFNEALTTGLAMLSGKIDDLSAKLSTET